MSGCRVLASSRHFDEYLVPVEKFATLKLASELPLAVATDCDQYLHDRLELLEAHSPQSTAWLRPTTYRMPSSPPRQA